MKKVKTVKGATMVAEMEDSDEVLQEQFAARSEWEKSFQLGIDFYLDGGRFDSVDEQEIRQRCQELFERTWAKGGGRFLADRYGQAIRCVARWAAASARWMGIYIMRDHWPTRPRAAGEKNEAPPTTAYDGRGEVRARIEAIKARNAAAAGEKK